MFLPLTPFCIPVDYGSSDIGLFSMLTPTFHLLKCSSSPVVILILLLQLHYTGIQGNVLVDFSRAMRMRISVCVSFNVSAAETGAYIFLPFCLRLIKKLNDKF